MKLTTDRLIIRFITLKDVDDYYEYAKNPEIGPNAGWKPIESRKIAERVVASMVLKKETYGIILRQNDKLIGTIAIYNDTIRKYRKACSIGFSVSADYQNMGYATEALKAIIEYIFRYLDYEIIEIGHHVGNYKSKRVIEKCGFYYNGRLDKFKVLYDGTVIDADFYSLTKEDYKKGLK